MNTKNLSRRDFLRLGALTAAGLALNACAPKPPAPATEAAPTQAAAPLKQVTLDVMAPVAEYEGAYREIWNVFEASHPDIKDRKSVV